MSGFATWRLAKINRVDSSAEAGQSPLEWEGERWAS
jgi:hypothetical protein